MKTHSIPAKPFGNRSLPAAAATIPCDRAPASPPRWLAGIAQALAYLRDHPIGCEIAARRMKGE